MPDHHIHSPRTLELQSQQNLRVQVTHPDILAGLGLHVYPAESASFPPAPACGWWWPCSSANASNTSRAYRQPVLGLVGSAVLNRLVSKDSSCLFLFVFHGETSGERATRSLPRQHKRPHSSMMKVRLKWSRRAGILVKVRIKKNNRYCQRMWLCHHGDMM